MKALKALPVLLGITATGVFAFSAPALADREPGPAKHHGNHRADNHRQVILWAPAQDRPGTWNNPLGDAIDTYVTSTLDHIFNGPHHRR
jgi:hypothetical protein